MRYIKSYKIFEGEFDAFDNKSGEGFWGDMAAGVLPICSVTGRILVAYRSKHVNEPHTYGVFGGKLDDGETSPIEAAKRELHEESGYNGHFNIIPAFVFKSSGGGFEYHNFIGIVDHEFKPAFDWETESAKWLTLKEFIALKSKHFGLQLLIDNNIDIIKKYAK